MWTSAATRKFVEIFAADNRPERVASYVANFVDMVVPGDTLQTKVNLFSHRSLIIFDRKRTPLLCFILY